MTSYCAETQEGWYHDTNGDSNYGCFKGQKVTVNKGDTLTTRVVNFEMRRQMHKKFENEKELVRRLNEKQRSWVATSYSEYETLTVEEMKGRAGHMAAKQWSQERRRVNRLLTDNSELSDESMLLSVPRSWDWRNVSGVNYVPPVRHQGACGSCYVFATTAMLESRIRIQYKNKYKITLSPQEVVSCSCMFIVFLCVCSRIMCIMCAGSSFLCCVSFVCRVQHVCLISVYLMYAHFIHVTNSYTNSVLSIVSWRIPLLGSQVCTGFPCGNRGVLPIQGQSRVM